MELKPPGNYDWIGLGFLFIWFCLFHYQRGMPQMCMYFIFIGISIDLKMMSRGVQKVQSFWAFLANEQPETLLRKANGM